MKEFSWILSSAASLLILFGSHTSFANTDTHSHFPQPGITLYNEDGPISIDQEAINTFEGRPPMLHGAYNMIIPFAVEYDDCQDEIKQIQKDNPSCTGALELIDRTRCAQMLWATVGGPINHICIEQVRAACYEYCLASLGNGAFVLSCVVDACMYYIDNLTKQDI